MVEKLAEYEAHMVLIKERIETVKRQYESAKGQQITGMPHGSSLNKDLSGYIIKLEELNSDYESYERKANKAYDEIGKLPDPKAQRIMLYRYRDELCWNEIAERMKCSKSKIIRIHRKNIKNLKNSGKNKKSDIL